MILNCKDHYRAGALVNPRFGIGKPSKALGFRLIDQERVESNGFRHGVKRELRVG